MDGDEAAMHVLDALRDVGAVQRGTVESGTVVAELVNGEQARLVIGDLRDPVPGSVVVADRIVEGDRRRLDGLGVSWLDLRGHLKLRHGVLWIDADVPALPVVRTSVVVDPLGGPVVAAAAFAALLVHPDRLPGIRALARDTGATGGGVSLAVKRLTDAGLLTRDRRAAVPSLFWEVADAWRPQWIPLAELPAPEDGLVVVGDQAAEALGAPIGGTGRAVQLLSPDAGSVRRLVRAAGSIGSGDPDAWVAVAPTPAATTSDPAGAEARGYPVAHPVIVALSLAGDAGRGAEIVRAWDTDGARPW